MFLALQKKKLISSFHQVSTVHQILNVLYLPRFINIVNTLPKREGTSRTIKVEGLKKIKRPTAIKIKGKVNHQIAVNTKCFDILSK